MFVIKEMRLNKFEPKPIVSNRELFVAKGESPGTIHSKDTADCFSEPSVVGASKTKMLGLAQDIASKAIEHAKSDGEANKLNKELKDL